MPEDSEVRMSLWHARANGSYTTANSGELLAEEGVQGSSVGNRPPFPFFLHLEMEAEVLLFGKGEIAGKNKPEKPSQPRSQQLASEHLPIVMQKHGLNGSMPQFPHWPHEDSTLLFASSVNEKVGKFLKPHKLHKYKVLLVQSPSQVSKCGQRGRSLEKSR